MARNSNKPWTPDDDGRLLQMCLAGEALATIALTLKRTVSAVERRSYTVRHQYRVKKIIPETAQPEARELHDRGH